jgi:hypothetical protein
LGSLWKHRPGPEFIKKLTERYPYANVGVICGLSGVTVVDIDDLDLLPQIIERFGDTPLRTYTPSGGVHLWYRSSGEGCPDLRKSEGLAVDIKGIGGQVVVPPSVRFNGEFEGRVYGFLAGSWDDLTRLPTIHAHALVRNLDYRHGSIRHAGGVPMPLRAVKQGYRNNVLFCSLLRRVKACDDTDALFDTAQTLNTDFDPPLEASEVAKVALSVWRIETEGRNWVGKEQRVYTLKSELEALAAHPNGGDGLLLLSKLRMTHWAHIKFAISPKAMAKAQVFPGWGIKCIS